MSGIRGMVISDPGAALNGSLPEAKDLSNYRYFQFATSLTVVAKQLRMKPSNAKTRHQRPALIRELGWQAPPEGLTVDDVIEAISFRYGVAIRPGAEEVILSSTHVTSEGGKVKGPFRP